MSPRSIDTRIGILALDPSTACTGYAFCKDESIIEAGFLPALIGETEAERYRDMCNKYIELLDRLKPDLTIIESYFFSSRFATGCNISVELRGVLKLTSFDKKIPYEMISPSQWKHTLVDRALMLYQDPMFKRCKTPLAKANKWRKVLRTQFGKLKSKKLITILALEKLGIICPKKIVNPLTEKKINFPNDVSDALGILVAYLSEQNIIYDFQNIKWNFTIPEI
jgi:hypothetical protein